MAAYHTLPLLSSYFADFLFLFENQCQLYLKDNMFAMYRYSYIDIIYNFFSLSRLQEKLQANNINDNKTKNCQSENNSKVKERKVLARLPPGATAAGVFPSPPPPGVLVIRTPRGPDGTKGFVRR